MTLAGQPAVSSSGVSGSPRAPADESQLAGYQFSKLVVAGSSPVVRSKRRELVRLSIGLLIRGMGFKSPAAHEVSGDCA